MKFLKKYKTMIIILGIVVIGAIIYTVMANKIDDSLLVSESSFNENSELQNELLSLLLEIKSIKLDENILSDAAFISLEDFSQEIILEPIGRKNPFAPVNASEIKILFTENEVVE